MKIKTTQLRKALACLLLLSTTFLSGCKNAKENPNDKQAYISRTAFKLNTVVTINIYDKQENYLLDHAIELCDYYEKIFSRTNEASELYQYNHGLLNTATDGTNQAVLSEELSALIERGLYYGNLSKGNFDITIAPLADLWNFTATNPKVPADNKIQSLLGNINYEDVSVNNRTVTMANTDMNIDLGAIAKGYIADRIKDYLVSEGVKSATINLGGNVLCVGKKPDGSDFNIGIQKPFADRNETVAAIGINDMSVVSSGIYERCFTENDVFYHHILNPNTGYPYDTDLVSVTIISEKSVDGDGLSTTCFSLGLKEGLELINSLENTYAIFITSDYELHYSDGLEENFKITHY